MPEVINFRLDIPGDKTKNYRPFTYEDFVRLVDQTGYSDHDKDRIKAKARSYPPGALNHLANNIHRLLK